jgi:hypothetical protein
VLGEDDELREVARIATAVRLPARPIKSRDTSSCQRYRRRNPRQPKPAKTSLARVSLLWCRELIGVCHVGLLERAQGDMGSASSKRVAAAA